MHTIRSLVPTVLYRALLLAGAALFVRATALRAQAVASIGPWLSQTVGGTPSHTIAGISAGIATGGFGLRVGGGISAPMSASAATSGTSQPGVRGWSADGDLLIYPTSLLARMTRELIGPSPYLLVGGGYSAWPGEAASDLARLSWSYGGGLDVPISSRLALNAEGRTRRSILYDSTRLTSARGRFELRLGLTLRFGGSPSSRRGGRPWSLPSGTMIGIPGLPGDALPSGAAGASAARVIPTAERYLGTKYVWGGSSPDEGFDCSGYVQYVFARHSVKLPRTSRAQATVGARLAPKWSALQAGDLVMFAEPGESISHVAIYAGRSRIIHATSSGGKVRYDDLDTPRGQWFTRRLVAARRVTPDASGLLRDFLDHEIRGALDAPDRAPPPDSARR